MVPSWKSYFLHSGTIFTLNLSPLNVLVKSCSIFSGFFTPTISYCFPGFFTPKTSQPPAVLEKALTVSHTFLGTSERASLTSKSSHSMSESFDMRFSLVNYSEILFLMSIFSCNILVISMKFTIKVL